MGTLSDIFLGNRPDMVIPNQLFPFLDEIDDASRVGIGKAGRYARKDLVAMRNGRIEEAGRLRPVLSAINANKAASYRTAEREAGKALAFSDDMGLHAAMMGELTGRLDENASTAFANAAAGAYGDAESTLESARRYKHDLRMRGATARAGLATGSMYDRSRRGGILGDLLKSWLSPESIFGVGKLFGGGGAATSAPAHEAGHGGI